MRLWSIENSVLSLAVLIVSVCDLVHGQGIDVLPDIPTGAISVRARVFSNVLPVEHVQTNPVGFTQIVGPIDLAGVPNAGAPNDSSDLAIANYGGKVSLFDSSGVEFAIPLLDLNNPLSPSHNPDFSIGQAHGLSSIAFHPSFADDTSAGYKKFYTLEAEFASSGIPDFGGDNFPSLRPGSHHDDVLYEYTMSSLTARTCGDDCTKREVLRVLQPGWHHNLGDLAFDADELLYISSGDGSTAGTTAPIMSDNSTVLTNLFGKVLRIDPFGNNSANGRYGVPANPFIDGPQGNVDEIYAYGLRNPYRLSFDPDTGDLYASETGELNIESINRLVAGGNHGWNLKEGSFLYDPITREVSVDTDADGDGMGDIAHANGLIDPIFEYDRGDGRAIIGGVLYRGSLPQLTGRYVFADFDGRLFYGDPTTGEEFEFQLDPTGDSLPSKIHSVNADENGELYVMGIKTLSDDESVGWAVRLLATGDFDANDRFDLSDVDALTAEIVSGNNDGAFDLTGDGNIDRDDLTQWLSAAATHNGFSQAYLPGDSNLDGLVSSTDLNNLAFNWQQEVASWSGGDFTVDGTVNSADLNKLALNWWRSIPLASSTNAPVPEPSAFFLTVAGLALICRRSRCANP